MATLLSTTVNGTITTTSHGTSANWKSAYDWGNHASAGYITSSGSISGTASNITAYTINQSVGTGNGPTFADVYTNGWFRNNAVNTGLYNQSSGNHFYSRTAAKWGITGNGGNIHLEFRSNHESTLRGVVYADTSNQIGFLNNGEGWAIRANSSNNVFVHGTDLTINADNAGSSNINMNDGDEGARIIHCNSNRIGFLTQAGSWGAYCDDSGNWTAANFSGSSSGTNTGDQTNISGNAATATTANSLAANTSPTIQVLNFSGVGTNSGNANQSYAIYQEGGAWGSPFPDLCIGYHTGIKIGAYFGYNGIRFYNNSDMVTETFSVGNGDNHVRVANNLYVGGTISGSNLSGTNTGDQTNISGNAATATNVAASGITGQTGMWTSAARPGAYRLYRNDDNSAYNVQTTWSANISGYWSLRGYNGDTYHAPCYVGYSGYADSAGSASSAARATRANGNFYIDDNYGNTVVGVYSASRLQGVFAMGDAYKLAADGSSAADHYGIAWSHPNAGGTAARLTNHGMLVQGSGQTWTAISDSIWCIGDITAFSDARVKANVEVIDNPLERLSKVRGVTFTRIDLADPTKRYAGVIAQEMREALPEVVTEDGNGELSVSYGNTVSLLIESIKAQQVQIEELKLEVKKLKG